MGKGEIQLFSSKPEVLLQKQINMQLPFQDIQGDACQSV